LVAIQLKSVPDRSVIKSVVQVAGPVDVDPPAPLVVVPPAPLVVPPALLLLPPALLLPPELVLLPPELLLPPEALLPPELLFPPFPLAELPPLPLPPLPLLPPFEGDPPVPSELPPPLGWQLAAISANIIKLAPVARYETPRIDFLIENLISWGASQNPAVCYQRRRKTPDVEGSTDA
jgi:hypothetical protein